MNRLDLVELVNAKDPNGFRGEFQLIDPARLPKQNLDRLYDNEIWSKWDDDNDVKPVHDDTLRWQESSIPSQSQVSQGARSTTFCHMELFWIKLLL